MAHEFPGEQALFEAARKLDDDAERAAYLAEACGDNVALRERVSSLLRAWKENTTFLESSPTAVMAAAHTARQARPDAPTLSFLSPSDQPDSLGRLGQYEMLEVVGRGGMGVVFKARDTKLHRIVAVKVLAPELASNPIARKRFLREAQAAAAVSHDHIVRIYAVEENDAPASAPAGTAAASQPPYLVMEFIDGQSLEQKLDRVVALELKEVLRIGRQIAAGLAAAHAQGLVHRDVKPANILLQNGIERVQITDFGLARAVDDVTMTKTGEVAGTPYYMSPEQAQGLPIDARSDLFSLGSVLYAMCTGRSPFRAETTMAVLRRVCDDQPRSIREVNPEIPEWLVAIIDRLLQKNRDDRFQTAEEVAELLGKHLAHVQHPASAPFPVTVEPVSRPPRGAAFPQKRWLVAATILLAVLGTFAATEGTGVTRLTGTVIRIVTGEGTLVIEIDDPSVRVSLNDKELTIAGAGLNEIKLQPGRYHFQATKDGQPVKTELVTIRRGDRQVVTVRAEPAPGAVHQAASNDAGSIPLAITEVHRVPRHTAGIQGIAHAPEGDRAYSVAQDRSVIVWNSRTGEIIDTWTDYKTSLFNAAISPDGRWFACGDGDGRVLLRNLTDGREQALLGHRRLVSSIAFAGPHLLTTSLDGTARQWDLEKGEEIRSLTDDGHMLAAAATRDKRFALVAGQSKPMRIWNLESGELARRLDPAPEAWTAAIHPDGQRAITGHLDGVIRVWDLITGRMIRAFPAHQEAVSCLAATADGRHCISGSFDKTLKVFDIESGKTIAQALADSHCVTYFALSPDGRRLVSGGGMYVDKSSQNWRGDGDYAIRFWELPKSVWPKEAATPQASAFVVLRGEGNEAGRFKTLLEAVIYSSPGDTIEIRGNGPFFSEQIPIAHPLTIRAAAGFAPVLLQSPQGGLANSNPLIIQRGPLVLEGIQIEMAGPEQKVLARAIDSYAPLSVANARIVSAPGFCISSVSDCDITNSVLLAGADALLVPGLGIQRQRLNIQNSICSAIDVGDVGRRAVDLSLTSNTFTNRRWLLKVFPAMSSEPMQSKPRPQIESQLRIRGKHNLYDVGESLLDVLVLHKFQESFTADSVRTWLGDAVDHTEEQSLIAGRGPVARLAKLDMNGWHDYVSVVSEVADWNSLWKKGEMFSEVSQVQFEGGDLKGRFVTGMSRIPTSAFRLRQESAGYRGGRDGKDLGADVDLVGPGEAYERWKRTPEYQKWQEETHRLITNGTQQANQPFVVLRGDGAEVASFSTLTDAVSSSSAGDTVEIRGNGPFVTPALVIGHALNIRAGAGFRPAIEMADAATQADPLIFTKSPLVLEGLELRRAGSPAATLNWQYLIETSKDLYAANCRLVMRDAESHIKAWGAGLTELRNCEFLAPKYVNTAHTPSTIHPVWAVHSYAGRGLVLDNSILVGRLYLTRELGEPGGAVFRLTNNTWRKKGEAVQFALYLDDVEPKRFAEADGITKFLEVHASGNVFATDATFAFAQESKLDLLATDEAADLLARMVAWRGDRNVHMGDGAFLALKRVGPFKALPPPNLPDGLDGWNQLWGSVEEASLAGTVRFQGGDLLSKTEQAPEQLTPEDFRLREDSAGYRAGQGGKDLGADVDLVGPGEAYERWKATPTYEEWQDETRRLIGDAAKRTNQPFVVLNGDGAEVASFATLADAVTGSTAGDTIEIRGNGPFVSDSVTIRHPLVIRAGQGFTPSIAVSQAAADANMPLIWVLAPLGVEGLELRRIGGAVGRVEWRDPCLVFTHDDMHMANCRLIMDSSPGATIYAGAKSWNVRNCQFSTNSGTALHTSLNSGRGIIENCLSTYGGIHLSHPTRFLRGEVLVRCNTLVGATINLVLRTRPDLGTSDEGQPPLHLELTDNVIVGEWEGAGVLYFGQNELKPPLAASEAETLLPRLLKLSEQRNAYLNGALLRFRADEEWVEGTRGHDLADWDRFWNQENTGSLQGTIRLAGGQLAGRAFTALEQITPNDFRLREDSAGYQAGPDGKDLGADIDLVGPGEAYERWKQNPEYSQWREETSRLMGGAISPTASKEGSTSKVAPNQKPGTDE